MKKRSNAKAIIAFIALGVILILGASTTIAWLTKTSSISNTFMVGTFTNPTKSPTDPTATITLDGNIYEPSWNATEDHVLVPGVKFAKDPYIGIGTGSEDAVVYAYVENNFSNKVYFTLNAGWEAVTGTAGSKTGTYTSGLFKYTAGLQGATSADKWTTTPLFSEVEVAEDATEADLTVAEGKPAEIKISSFLHQAKSSNGTAIDEATILATVKSTFNIE